MSNIINSYCKRPNDVCARIGGDEFTVLIYDSNVSYVEEVCNSIIKKVNQLAFTLKQKADNINFGISIGVSINEPDENHPIKLLMELADKSLYSIKEGGKNGFIISNKNQLIDSCDSNDFMKPIV